jgi:hypothetical protein
VFIERVGENVAFARWPGGGAVEVVDEAVAVGGAAEGEVLPPQIGRGSDPSRQAQAVNGQLGRAPTDTGRPRMAARVEPVPGPFNTCINTVHERNSIGRRFGRGGAGACIGAATLVPQ